MRKINNIFLAILLLLSSNIFSQSKTLDNVIDVELQSSVEITNNKQIVGYALFYKVDKLKKAALYRLQILDENLKPLGSNEFEGAKDLLLRRAVYESGHILLSFYDKSKVDGYERFVKVFDLKGKATGEVSYDPDKVKKGMFGAAIAESMESIYEGTDNVEGQGFVCVYQSKAKTGGVDIQMLNVNGKLKWEQNITADKGDRSDLYLVSTTPHTILLFQMDRKSVMSRDADIFLVGLSTQNGKTLFKKPLDIDGWSFEPMMIKTSDDNKLKIVSSMFNADAKFATAKPKGISIGELNDSTGDIKVIKNFSFLNDLGNVLDMKNESKSEDGYIKAHDICLMPDGSMVMIGEFFRKTVSATGMAMKILSKGRASAAQATIEDLFLLRIDNAFKAKSLEKIEKRKERYPLPTDGLPIGLMARLLTYQHSFGYMYTDEGIDGSIKSFLARGSFDGERYGVEAITIDPVKGFKTKKFNLEKEKNVDYYVARGKPGTVLIMKYNSKEKTISLNLEKVN